MAFQNDYIFGGIAKQFRLIDWWCPSVHILVNLCVEVCFSHVYDYRHDTLSMYRPQWDLLNCDLPLWPWPWLFLFKVTLWLTFALKFALADVYYYRHNTLCVERLWWDLSFDLALWPWPWLFFFKVTLSLRVTFAFKFVFINGKWWRVDVWHIWRK